VWVTLHREEGRAHVSVRDNGKGFEMRPSRGSAHGLMGMRYRVENAGGVMQVQSATGEGTLVQAWIPVMPEGPPEQAEETAGAALEASTEPPETAAT
jgi:nitrate/nitrite-specific signal transduction histidine kinase